MQPFTYARADAAQPVPSASVAGTRFLAGGTTLLDLMKLGVETPPALIDIGPLRLDHGGITIDEHGLHLGAMATMAEAAAHPGIRTGYPAIADSLALAASAQLRNMASLGGNVLQRTRCSYFRDAGTPACNKRTPGSGCAAMHGVNRDLAVLGVSEHCIAHYPGDFAVALAALGATVNVVGPGGARSLDFEALHVLPGSTPHVETTLRDGELITSFHVPAAPYTARSLYVKVRDRQSYAFAQASAAVALSLDGALVREVRIGLGGLAAKPWRAHAAEASLRGARLDETTARAAADAEFAAAVTHGENASKPELGRRTLVRALLSAAEMEI